MKCTRNTGVGCEFHGRAWGGRAVDRHRFGKIFYYELCFLSWPQGDLDWWQKTRVTLARRSVQRGDCAARSIPLYGTIASNVGLSCNESIQPGRLERRSLKEWAEDTHKERWQERTTRSKKKGWTSLREHTHNFIYLIVFDENLNFRWSDFAYWYRDGRDLFKKRD